QRTQVRSSTSSVSTHPTTMPTSGKPRSDMTQLASRPAPAPDGPAPGSAPLRTAPMSPQAVIRRTVRYVLLSIISVAVLTPFAWMALSSLKRNNEVFTAPIPWFPDEWQWHNYVDIWTKADMTTWLGNTIFLSVTVTALQVLTGSFAA